jgi:beta-glucosidase
MRANAPGAAHGIVLNLNPTYALSDAPKDLEAARHVDGTFNRWFLDPLFKGSYPEDTWQAYKEHVPEVRDGDIKLIRQPLDFLGVNYYSRMTFGRGEGAEAGVERTTMGWEVYPRGLTDLLVRLDRDYDLPPLYITENGAAYPDRLTDGRVHDSQRISYYERHLGAVREAIEQGVDVRGYYAWSLMDNFEWAKGYSKRFGLVYVDYETQARTVKDSGRWYRDFVMQGTAQAAT